MTDQEFLQKSMEMIARSAGITTPLQLVAMTKSNDQTYADILAGHISDAFAQRDKAIAALKEVLDHRREDKDGNYVCWIGEGTFQRCHAAVHGEPQQQPIDPL